MSKGCLCMEGWPAGSQPWAPAHTSEVGVSMNSVFVQLPGSDGLPLCVPLPWEAGVSRQKVRPGSAVSLSQRERGPRYLLLSCLPCSRSLPKQKLPCSWKECGGGRITCCEQHFCPAPSHWGRKPTVLGNLSSYCWLCSAGASKETEQGGR